MSYPFRDPSNPTNDGANNFAYRYAVTPEKSKYEISAALENTSDAKLKEDCDITVTVPGGNKCDDTRVEYGNGSQELDTKSKTTAEDIKYQFPSGFYVSTSQ